MSPQPLNSLPNVDVANQIVQNNNSEVSHNPELAADAIQINSLDAADALFATSHFTSMAKAIDDHIQTYNSAAWLRNALKTTPDIANAIIKTPVEIFNSGGMNGK